jgi:hypothetical protein
MPDVKISEATPAGTLLESDLVPIARSGSDVPYNATMSDLATYITVLASTHPPQMSNLPPTAGKMEEWSRADHVHPTDTSRAPIDSPNFIGSPKAPTMLPTDNSDALATTKFAHALFDTGPRAPLDSPQFIGTPRAPTPGIDDNTDLIATTEYVQNQGSTEQPTMNGQSDPGVSRRWAREDHVHPRDAASGGIVDAPADGNAYGRLNATWTQVLPTAGGVLTGPVQLPNGTPNIAALGLGSADYGLYRGSNTIIVMTGAASGVTSFDINGVNTKSLNLGGTGRVTQMGTPAAATDGASKGYVDGLIPAASATPPLMDGTVAVGTAATWSRGDHVHPTDTSRYAASNPSGFQTAAQVTAVLPVASSTTPNMDGTGAVGTATTWARADHAHPTDTSRYAANNPSGYQTASQVSAALPPASNTAPAMDGVGAAGTGTAWARNDHVHPTNTSLAPIISPAFTVSAGPQIVSPVIVQASTGANPVYVAPTKPNWTTSYLVMNGQNLSVTLDAIGGSPFLNGRTAEGFGPSNLTSSTLDRVLFGLRGFGYSAAGFSTTERARINFAAAENYTDTAQGSYISFQTSPIGSVAVPPEVARLSPAGNLLIGTTTDSTYRLDVVGSGRFTGKLAGGGTTTNDNAAAGQIGEFISASIASPGVTASNAVALNVTTISLTAGDWDVQGQVGTIPAAGTKISDISAWPSTTSAAYPTTLQGGLHRNNGLTTQGGDVVVLTTGRMRLSLAVTTTVYLSALVAFAGGTLACTGFIGARRMR